MVAGGGARGALLLLGVDVLQAGELIAEALALSLAGPQLCLVARLLLTPLLKGRAGLGDLCLKDAHRSLLLPPHRLHVLVVLRLKGLNRRVALGQEGYELLHRRGALGALVAAGGAERRGDGGDARGAFAGGEGGAGAVGGGELREGAAALVVKSVAVAPQLLPLLCQPPALLLRSSGANISAAAATAL